ncbi:hypothetical protein DL98DRAFT_522298 [Cadophora sp. DSE1049]|nr:hypothetical protein DL98DRAFT_522298 [Cadophora sp. DSE1049]
MPWNVRPALVVLWGVCWMFYPPQASQLDDYTDENLDYNAGLYLDDPFRGTFLGHPVPDTPLSSQHMTQQNHDIQQPSLIPGASQDYTYLPIPSVYVQEGLLGNGASEHNQLPLGAGDISWNNNQYTPTPTEDSNQPAEGFWNNNQLLPTGTDGTRDNSQLAPTFAGWPWNGSEFPPALPEDQFNLSSSSQSIHPNLTTSNAIVEAGGGLSQLMVTTPWPVRQGLIPCNCTKCNGAPQTKAHRDRVEKPYTCSYPECDKRAGFGAKRDLQNHINSIHEQSEKFFCRAPGCSRSNSSPGNRAFLRLDKLKEHIKSQHEALGPDLLNNLRASHTPARGTAIPAPALRRSASPNSRLGDTSRGIRKRPRSRGRTSSPESEHYAIEGSRGRRKDKEELDRRIVHIEIKLEVLETKVERMKRELEECKRMAAR